MLSPVEPAGGSRVFSAQIFAGCGLVNQPVSQAEDEGNYQVKGTAGLISSAPQANASLPVDQLRYDAAYD